MKFLRQMGAVLVLVGVIVGLGVLWGHSGAAGLVADGGGDRRVAPGSTAPFEAPPPALKRGFGHDGRGDRGRGGPFSWSNIDDLVQSLVVEGGIVAAVVAVDQVRRRRRRARGAFPRAPVAAAATNRS